MPTYASDPVYPAVVAPVVEVRTGITIRQYMATAALSGLLASRDPSDRISPTEFAYYAVEQADALIKALNETK